MSLEVALRWSRSCGISWSRPVDQNAREETLWQEQWNKLLWGPQLELDKAEAASFAQAKTQAGLSGKGAQLGKGKRHWSNVAIYTNGCEPYPFELDMVVVEAVYFLWDEMCDKFKAEQHKIGDYGVATIPGKLPVSVGATFRTEGVQAPVSTGQNAPASKATSAANDPWVDYVPKGKGSSRFGLGVSSMPYRPQLKVKGISRSCALCPFEILYADGAQITTPRVSECPFEIFKGLSTLNLPFTFGWWFSTSESLTLLPQGMIQ